MLYRAMPSVERYGYETSNSTDLFLSAPPEYVIRINAKNFPISEEENTLLNSSYGVLTLAFAKESCKNKKEFCEIASFMKETNIDSTQFKIFKNGFLNQGKIR